MEKSQDAPEVVWVSESCFSDFTLDTYYVETWLRILITLATMVTLLTLTTLVTLMAMMALIALVNLEISRDSMGPTCQVYWVQFLRREGESF